MSTVLFWFRNDLRLHDQPALHAACSGDTRFVVPVFCLPEPGQISPWGFPRMGRHRRACWTGALRDLSRQLARMHCPLLICDGPPSATLPRVARSVGAGVVVCEEIAAPEERAEVEALRVSGLLVRTVWQSSLFDPVQLPWSPSALPSSFTAFRQAMEQAQVHPSDPLAPPASLPPWPPGAKIPFDLLGSESSLENPISPADARSSLPGGPAGLDGGEASGLAHLSQYLARRLQDSYRRTRNGLTGVDFSSKWSPWLATGALSARRILFELRRFEKAEGFSEGSYWLWFELLWRDYFRFLHLQHGVRLYRARGLSERPISPHNPHQFHGWCQAMTGEPLVDAAMRELMCTGYISNRLRQVVASYLIHELGGDWRAGAAWFESQLVDYDVYSNQGNWLYIAGRGTDPRGGRRFNVGRQAAEHDPTGEYQRMWSSV